jgi:hypothetical protein
MKRILFIFFFFFSYSFAVKDFIIRPHKNFYKIIYSVNINYPLNLNQKIESDKYNIFKYSGHFRVIFGKDYNNSIFINDLANKILDIANYVWKKEVEEFKFKSPRNSDKFYIDIYIGNTDAYNPEIGYVNIEDDYCGFASAYNNGTPYFVINPEMNINIIKVTIAHEFFHTIQYAYGLDEVSLEIWDKNIWFLEATAVMMEDEVYDYINDYLNYLPYYIYNTNLPLDYSDGEIEYGKVLFAKYIKEKYGIGKIRKIFEDYKTNETILDELKKEFDFNKLMLGFAKCLVNKNICFKEGKFYPNVVFYSENDSKSLGYYGILFVNYGNDNYLSSINYEYLQEDFQGRLNRKINVNNDGLILINKQNDNMNENIINYNNYNGFEIKKGWNLVSNIFADNIDLTKLKGVTFWVYRNGKYKAYSNLKKYEQAIKKANLSMKNNYIFKNEGFWIYSDKDFNLNISKINLADNNISLHKGWQIVGFSSTFKPKYINAKSIWEYDKSWRYYSNRYFNYPKIDLIKPLRGYFIFK